MDFISLVKMSIRAKRMGNLNFAKSKLGQELTNLINAPAQVVSTPWTPGIYGANGVEMPAPAKFEEEITQMN